MSMRANKSIVNGLALVCVALLFMQCEKDEPSMEATMETKMGLTSNAATQGKLTIENAWIRATALEIVAENTDGNQTKIAAQNTNPDPSITLINGDNPTPFKFDLTRGNYEPVNLSLSSQEDTYSLQFPNGPEAAPDFEDFLANAKTSMGFVGKFTNRGETIRVYVALNIMNRLNFPALQGNLPLVGISAENVAKIVIDPAYLLAPLTTQRLESAMTFTYQGQKTIFIHPQYNADIYIDIEERMFDTRNFVRAEIIAVRTNG
jgi:hypothetical protein